MRLAARRQLREPNAQGRYWRTSPSLTEPPPGPAHHPACDAKPLKLLEFISFFAGTFYPLSEIP
jgi:hypothetical protein